MSYDLYLLPERPGEGPSELMERLEEEDVPVTAEEEERVRRLAAALQDALPGLEDNSGDDPGPREVHLLDRDGLEVSVYPHSGSVSVPYWESLDTAALVRDLARVAEVVEAHTDWRVYDPQQEAWIDALRDADGVRATFDQGRAVLREIQAEESAPRRPWWRRLGRRS